MIDIRQQIFSYLPLDTTEVAVTIGVSDNMQRSFPHHPPEGARPNRSEPPRVEVIIPCYNQGRFLGAAIDSVLQQSYPHVAAIVVDDGSTDDTPAVAARYGDRIQYLRKRNAGLGAARNSGLLEVTGEFVLFLDSDDLLRPDTVAQHMRAASARPTGAVFHGACQLVDLAGQPMGEPVHRELGEDAFHTLLAGNCFPCPNSVVVRREVLANVGLFDVWMPSGAEDWEMWIRLAAHGCEFVAVPEAVSLYRRYPGTMSSQFERMGRSCAFVVRQSQRYHVNCGRCRKAIARANRLVREWYLDGTIAAVREIRATRGLRAGLVRAACLASRNPSLCGRLLNEFGRYRRAAKQARCGELPASNDLHGPLAAD